VKDESRRRRDATPVTLLRVGGVCVILACIVLGPAPPTETAAGAPPEVHGRYRLAPADMARARRLIEVAAEPEASGCAALIGSPPTVRDRVLLVLRCGDRGDLTMMIKHLPLGAHAVSRTAGDCLSATALPGVTCDVSGQVAGPLRRELIAAFDRVVARLFPDDPFVLESEWDAQAVVVAGAIAVLMVFLWLVVSGAFTFGSWGPGDWVAVVPFVAALAVREVWTLHSVQEIEIQFALAPVGRHSVVYPLFQLFYSRLVWDAQAVTFHVNAVLGALAIPPLFLFVRQRTGDRAVALVVGCFLAVHPLVARFAPTDSPYSLILVTWFSGLALLSAPAVDRLSTFGGAALLGVAASARMDGLLYLAASLLVLDPKLLVMRARNAPGAALAGACTIFLLIGAQMYFLGAFHLHEMVSDRPTWTRLLDMGKAAAEFASGDRLWSVLVLAGGLVGFSRRWRLGLCAFAAMVILLLASQFTVSAFSLIPPSGESPNAWHRLVPGAAMQCVVAGVGAVALARALIRRRAQYDWAASFPGIVAAVQVLLAHHNTLSARYVFNEEYAMVRAHLARGGAVGTGCDLFVRTKVDRDVDIRDYRRVAPGTTIVDCSAEDCVRSLANDRCQYYMRSAACFFHPDGLPPRCVGARSDEDIVRECLVPACRAFESAADLSPIDVRSLNPLVTFPHDSPSYPDRIPVALFRALARGEPPVRHPEATSVAATGAPRSGGGGCGNTGDALVLSASAAAAIEQAFARMQPALRYDDIHIECDHVIARLCAVTDPTSVCFSARLDPPSDGCLQAAGPFCVTFLDGAPTATAAAALIAGLQTVDRAALWSKPTANGPADPAVGSQLDRGPWRRLLVTAAEFVGLPIAIGALLGAALRRACRRRFAGVGAATILVGAPTLGLAVMGACFPPVGVGAALLAGVCVGIGAAWTAHRTCAGRVASLRVPRGR